MNTEEDEKQAEWDRQYQEEEEELDKYKELAPTIGEPRALTPEIVTMIQILAPAWKESTWFGIRYPEQAVVLMARAYELGFPLTSAFDYFDIITTKNGSRIFFKPKAAMALIYRSKLLKKLIIEDRKDSCYVYMQRRDNGYGFGFEFTLDMAKTAGIYRQGTSGPSAWEAHQATMLRWRSIGIVSQIVFTDVLSGLHLSSDTYEYFVDVTEGGV